MFLIGEESDSIIDPGMFSWESHLWWVNYLVVKPGWQRTGRGREWMDAAEKSFRTGVAQKNQQVRTSSAAVIAFCRPLGFQPRDGM